MTSPEYGLSSKQAKKLLAEHGRNELTPKRKESLVKKILHIVAEPMFLLLIVASVIYFLLGEPRDGAIMLIFVLATITIDVVQEWKTDKTLAALKDLSAPQIAVLRDGTETTIPSVELVPGDVMLLREGVKIPADGFVIRCSDLVCEEASLTGESEGVMKRPVSEENEPASGHWRRDYVYAGTMVLQGGGAILVDKTGAETEYGRIGLHVAEAPDRPTPLEKQTGRLVKSCAVLAAALFILVAVITFFNIAGSIGERAVGGVLSGVTLAMAMIPEEFPVILTVFLSMGAWRLAKKQTLIRRLPSVETLGAVSVLCVDKTGTITENRMSVTSVWSPGGETSSLLETMGLGCETDAYDPMERAMVEYCEKCGIERSHIFGGELLHEYTFTNELKIMGHVWLHDGEIIAAAKGSYEKLLSICDISPEEAQTVCEKAEEFSAAGLRVIAVGIARFSRREDIPADITGLSLGFLGLIGLSDPPRPTVRRDIAVCTKAGIRTVMITGDNGVTASAIAAKIGMAGADDIVTGDMIDAMSEEELRERVKTANVYSRVIPEHKMRIVKALRQNGETVAMTGDGVNDAPALKYADIGIAMGKRGSEVSREAADMILLNDDFSTIVDTIRDGRRIYDNIRKAVGYVFTIHIPIALSSLIAPLLGIDSASLFLLPLHVVLLELIIDPTCSVVLERQPAERDVMERPPRDPREKLLTLPTLAKSVTQGLVLAAAAFGSYLYMWYSMGDAPLARSMGLAVMMLGNLFLVQVVSSHCDIAAVAVKRLSRDAVMWGVGLGTLLLLAAVIYTPLSGILKLSALPLPQLLCAIALAAVSVFWYDLVKLAKRKKADA